MGWREAGRLVELAATLEITSMVMLVVVMIMMIRDSVLSPLW